MPAQDNQKKQEEVKKATKPSPLKTLLTWEAPERPFKKRTREYFTTIGAIVFLIGIILLFLKEWVLIMVLVALMFVAYIMSTIEPRKVGHQITNRGIRSGEKEYKWENLGRFWFAEKWGQKVLYVENMVGLPGQLILLLGEADQGRIKKILSEHLTFEEPEKTWVDRSSEWISRRVPLETSS